MFFYSGIHVEEWLVLKDHKEAFETDEEIISALLAQKPEEQFIDIFPIRVSKSISCYYYGGNRSSGGCV